jgi:hypothetical protein
MVFPVVGGNESKVYEISNSLRFNDDDSPNLTVAQSTPTDGSRWTWSGWVKRGNLSDGSNQETFASSYNGTNTDRIQFTEDDELHVEFKNGASTVLELHTTQLFRDVAAWYHIVVAFDSNLSQSNRVKIYVNGTQVTSFSTSTELSTSGYTTKGFNANSKNFVHGAYESSSLSNYYDGYLTEVNFVDGAAKAQTDFGEFDDNGVWIPKKYTGTYGNNGFFLQFKQTGTSQNSSGIGADTSGQDNHFAVSNLAATDITEDTCTNNFATLVPTLNMTLSEGNVKATTSRTSYWDGVHASIGVTSGKWYFETKASNAAGTFRVKSGVVGNPETFTILYNGRGTSDDPRGTLSNTYPVYGKGVWLENWYDEDYDSSSTASAQSSGDILQFALDMDNYKMWVGINGQFKDNSNNDVSYSDVASGSSATVTIPSAAYTGKTFFPDVWLRDDDGSFDNVAEINFGNPSFSISSGNTDGKYGNFEYAVPSGFYALCTKRLAEFG